MGYRHRKRPDDTGIVIGFVFCCFLSLFFVACFGTRLVLSIQYDIACGGHLKRAADANTIELAGEELDTALKHMKEQGWDKGGSTHLLFATPDCDVGFWYNNINSARTELASLASNTTQLEKTNVLMKLRETILDQGERGAHVTDPPAIDIYPNQWAFCIWGWASLLVALMAWIFWLIVVH